MPRPMPAYLPPWQYSNPRFVVGTWSDNIVSLSLHPRPASRRTTEKELYLVGADAEGEGVLAEEVVGNIGTKEHDVLAPIRVHHHPCEDTRCQSWAQPHSASPSTLPHAQVQSFQHSVFAHANEREREPRWCSIGSAQRRSHMMPAPKIIRPLHLQNHTSKYYLCQGTWGAPALVLSAPPSECP